MSRKSFYEMDRRLSITAECETGQVIQNYCKWLSQELIQPSQEPKFDRWSEDNATLKPFGIINCSNEYESSVRCYNLIRSCDL